MKIKIELLFLIIQFFKQIISILYKDSKDIIEMERFKDFFNEFK